MKSAREDYEPFEGQNIKVVVRECVEHEGRTFSLEAWDMVCVANYFNVWSFSVVRSELEWKAGWICQAQISEYSVPPDSKRLQMEMGCQALQRTAITSVSSLSLALTVL
jgi:hypothetical protein